MLSLLVPATYDIVKSSIKPEAKVVGFVDSFWNFEVEFGLADRLIGN